MKIENGPGILSKETVFELTSFLLHYCSSIYVLLKPKKQLRKAYLLWFNSDDPIELLLSKRTDHLYFFHLKSFIYEKNKNGFVGSCYCSNRIVFFS
jgi:hypothetical protein